MPNPRLIVVAGQKGGPGKSTTTINLAACFAAAGANVLVVDIDPQGSAVGWAESAGEALPFDFAASDDPQLLSSLKNLDYDYILVDTPGSLVEVEKNQALVPIADFVVIPSLGDPLGMEPLARTVHQVLTPTGVPFRVLLNNVSDRRGPAWPINTIHTLTAAGLPCFRTYIRSYVSLTDAPGTGAVVTQLTDGPGKKSARLYGQVVDEIRQLLDSADAGAVGSLR